LDDVHADCRALARRLDHDWNGNRWALPECYGLPIRRRDTLLIKSFLRADLIEGALTFRDALSSISNATILQDLLHLAVFTKRPMQRDEGQLGAIGQLEVRTFDIDLADLCA
jgi:hypothetical protein